jgi:hypothetical protein
MRYKKEDVWALTLHLFILFFFGSTRSRRPMIKLFMLCLLMEGLGFFG